MSSRYRSLAMLFIKCHRAVTQLAALFPKAYRIKRSWTPSYLASVSLGKMSRHSPRWHKGTAAYTWARRRVSAAGWCTDRDEHGVGPGHQALEIGGETEPLARIWWPPDPETGLVDQHFAAVEGCNVAFVIADNTVAKVGEATETRPR